MALVDNKYDQLSQETANLIKLGVRKKLEDMVRVSVEEEFKVLLEECIENTAKELQIVIQRLFDEVMASDIVNVIIKKGTEDGV